MVNSLGSFLVDVFITVGASRVFRPKFEVDMGTILGYPKEETVMNDEYITEVEMDDRD